MKAGLALDMYEVDDHFKSHPKIMPHLKNFHGLYNFKSLRTIIILKGLKKNL
jgi:hypothetical protein